MKNASDSKILGEVAGNPAKLIDSHIMLHPRILVLVSLISLCMWPIFLFLHDRPANSKFENQAISVSKDISNVLNSIGIIDVAESNGGRFSFGESRIKLSSNLSCSDDDYSTPSDDIRFVTDYPQITSFIEAVYGQKVRTNQSDICHLRLNEAVYIQEKLEKIASNENLKTVRISKNLIRSIHDEIDIVNLEPSERVYEDILPHHPDHKAKNISESVRKRIDSQLATLHFCAYEDSYPSRWGYGLRCDKVPKSQKGKSFTHEFGSGMVDTIVHGTTRIHVATVPMSTLVVIVERAQIVSARTFLHIAWISLLLAFTASFLSSYDPEPKNVSPNAYVYLGTARNVDFRFDSSSESSPSYLSFRVEIVDDQTGEISQYVPVAISSESKDIFSLPNNIVGGLSNGDRVKVTFHGQKCVEVRNVTTNAQIYLTF